MRALLAQITDNPVLVNLVFVVVVVAGVLGWTRLPKEQFPQLSTDRVTVSTIYPGASPADVEDQVLRPLEDALDEVEGIEHTFGTAIEGRGDVIIEFVEGTDAADARLDVERAVTAAPDLPADAEQPTVELNEVITPITYVGLAGDLTRVDLADRIADELSAIPGVKEVEVRGAAERVVRVDLDTPRALALGLDPARVAAAIEGAGRGGPAGDVVLADQRVLVRTERALEGVGDIREVPLVVRGGTSIAVGDVARVYEDWEDPRVLRHINGQPAIVLVLLRASDADAVRLVDEVDAWIADRRATLPAGLDLIPFDDSARIVRDRVNTLAANAAVGLVLVAGLLILFVGFRKAMLVLWGMPVAFCGAVALMWLTGTTVNVISTFALLVVTGIIVDDAVVIVENVARHIEMGKDRRTAAIDGTAEVIRPVFASTVTTSLAFAPLLLLEGTVGQVMSIIPIVVIFALAASLLEAFFVLPTHLAHYAKEGRVGGDGDNAPSRFLKGLYRPVVETVTRPWIRYGALLGLHLGFFAVLGLTAFMQVELSTPGNPYFVYVNLDLPPSTDPDRTRTELAELEQWLQERAGDMVVWYAATTGTQTDPGALPVVGAEFGQLRVGFVNEREVFERVPALLDDLRAHLRADPDLVRFSIDELRGGPPVGRDIDVRVRSREPAQVFPVALGLEEHLGERPGVYDVRNEAGKGSVTWQIQVHPDRAARFDLSESLIARAVRGALDGALAIELPIAERTTEVRVGLAGLEHADSQRLEDLPLRTPSGRILRLRQVGDVLMQEGVASIDRVDGQRAVRVSALIDDEVTSSETERDALEQAFAGLRAEHPDVDLFFGGELESTEEGFASLGPAALLAILLMYAVLAVQFRSYTQPVLILSAVPLGLAGVILGLFVFGMDISLIALIGTVGLAGIVVNDSLVMIDFINRQRREGMTAREAVIDGALTRLRPILITTVTTVAGLLPLALGVAGGEPLLAPMAVAISVGLAFATALTLVALPVLYMVLEDLRSVPARARARWADQRQAPDSP